MGVPNGYTSAQVVQAVPTGINSALVLVKAQTIGTTVSSVTVTDAFNATYENYLIILSGGLASSTPNLDLTLGATSTGYYYNNAYQAFGTGTFTTETATNAASFVRVGNGRADGLSSIIQIQQPNVAGRTLVQYENIAVATGGTNVSGGGYLDNTTSYTAFTLTVSTGTITGGTIRVYGYLNS